MRRSSIFSMRESWSATARIAPHTIDNDNRGANDTEYRRLVHNPPRTRRASTPGQCSVGAGGQSSVGAHRTGSAQWSASSTWRNRSPY